jgi:hypothetical protein
MSEERHGPYDKDKCGFCSKSDKTHPTQNSKNVAGYQRPENEDFSGKLVDSCQGCLIKTGDERA